MNFFLTLKNSHCLSYCCGHHSPPPPSPPPPHHHDHHHYHRGARDGAVVRVLASHQCSPGSNPDVDAICGLSLLLVLSFALRGFSPGTLVFPFPQKPTLPNSNSTRNQVDKDVLPPNHYLFIIIHLLFIITITVLTTKIWATYLQMLPRLSLHLL